MQNAHEKSKKQQMHDIKIISKPMKRGKDKL